MSNPESSNVFTTLLSKFSFRSMGYLICKSSFRSFNILNKLLYRLGNALWLMSIFKKISLPWKTAWNRPNQSSQPSPRYKFLSPNVEGISGGTKNDRPPTSPRLTCCSWNAAYGTLFDLTILKIIFKSSIYIYLQNDFPSLVMHVLNQLLKFYSWKKITYFQIGYK